MPDGTLLVGGGVFNDLAAAPGVGVVFLMQVLIVVFHADVLAVVHGVVEVSEDPALAIRAHHAAVFVAEVRHGQGAFTSDGFPKTAGGGGNVQLVVVGIDGHGGVHGVVCTVANACRVTLACVGFDGAAGNCNIVSIAANR